MQGECLVASSPQPRCMRVREWGEASRETRGLAENCNGSPGNVQQGNAIDSCLLMNGIATQQKKGEVEQCRGCLITFSPSLLFPHSL